MDRRNFLQLSIASATAFMATRAFGKSAPRPLGVQLYTVRDQAARDLPAVLAAIHKIGYQEVEPYWDVYDRPARELKSLIVNHGLRVPSGHFNYEGLTSKLDYAQELGVRYMVCPMLPENLRTSPDGYKRAADQFNTWGAAAKQRGMRFGFHNHNYEFRQLGDTTGYEILLQRTSTEHVFFEMDCYWIAQAGHDPVEMLKKHGSRIKLLHLKDRKPGFQPSQELNAAAEHFTEVGLGNLAWKSILAEASKAGVEHLFVERDSGDLSPIESLAISYRNLKPLVEL